MIKKVVFLSYINFSDSIAGAARVKMYSKMLRSEGVETVNYSIHDYQNASPLLKRLVSNKYTRRLSYFLRVFTYTLSTRKFANQENDIVFYLYPTTSVFLDYLLIYFLKLF